MLNNTLSNIATHSEPLAPVIQSLRMVLPRRSARVLALVTGTLLTAVALGLVFIPWQQTVTGTGKIIVYSAMDRPQNVEAQIPARLTQWKVQEGVQVKKGDTLAMLEDTDSKFLDVSQPERLEQQKRALQSRRDAAMKRARALEDQIAWLNQSRNAAIPTAGERAGQAVQRLRAAEQSLEAARQSLIAARDSTLPTADEKARQAEQRIRAAEQAVLAAQQNVATSQNSAIPTAEEKARQADDRIRAAQQSIDAAQQNLVTAELNRRRVTELYQKKLRSQRDNELAENEYVKNKTEVERAQAALEIARRDRNVAQLDQQKAQFDLVKAKTEVERAEVALEVAQRDKTIAELDRQKARVDVNRAKTEVERAVAALDIARRDTRVGDLDVAKITGDTGASLSSVQASLQSAQETIASANSDLLKLEVDLQNLRQRVAQQTVKSPCDGRVVRLLKVGAGATVKAGDVLAVVAPDTEDRAVELLVSDNDAPLLSVGRPVRLQFAGWPAVQFAGFPSVAAGTFGGRVAVIDPIDDGKNRYRIIVKPDWEAVKHKRDTPWPAAAYLRPGTEASGWIMLNRVSLGYELWRQFNAFPPTVQTYPTDAAAASADKK